MEEVDCLENVKDDEFADLGRQDYFSRLGLIQKLFQIEALDMFNDQKEILRLTLL